MPPVVTFWVGIAAAALYLPFSENPPNWARSVIKTTPLVAFALAVATAGGPAPLVIALALSALGDLALSRPGSRAFLAGLTAFAAAHVVYIVLFTMLSGQGPYMPFVDHTLLALFAAWVALSAEIWLVPYAGWLKWPVRGYVLAISIMALAALTLPLGAVAIGASYLVASDVILGYRNFRMDVDDPLAGRAGWLLWGLYVTGQALIVIGVLGLTAA